MFLNCLPQLIIVFIGGVQLMPAYEANNQETHIFGWSTDPDLNDTRCAIVVAPPRNPNTTWEARFWRNTYSKYIFYNALWKFDIMMRCLEFIFYHNCLDRCRVLCHSNSTIFVLIGNPGIIWHPETDQCVHTQIYTVPSISLDDGKIHTLSRQNIIAKHVVFMSFVSISLYA